MKAKHLDQMNCSVARTADIIGEWWTPLLLRDLLLGVSRFDDFQQRLGIARNTLTDRLNHLVEERIVEKVAYQEHPPRFDYRLTPKGASLWHVIIAMREWGDRWEAPEGAPLRGVHRVCGADVTLHLTCPQCGDLADRRDMLMLNGPGEGGDVLPARGPRIPLR
jgi:DNA-binding HxlR family transcriptional regulator